MLFVLLMRLVLDAELMCAGMIALDFLREVCYN